MSMLKSNTRILITLLILILPVAVANRVSIAVATAGQQGKAVRRENKVLQPTFGFELPASAKITTKLVNPKSKVTYLYVEIPPPEIPGFKESVRRPSGGGRDIRWGDVGVVPTPGDEPYAFYRSWQEANGLRLGLLAYISIYKDVKKKGAEIEQVYTGRFAVLFIDSEKGFLMLYYKA